MNGTRWISGSHNVTGSYAMRCPVHGVTYGPSTSGFNRLLRKATT